MVIRILPLLALFALSLTSCDVEQTESGEFPEVDIDTEAGNMPEFDVDWAEVNVNTTTRMVEVPRVTVEMVEEPVEVPVLNVDWPDDYGETAEQTFMVEADVNQEADLEIQEIFTDGNRMIVVANLEKDGELLQNGAMMRVSDQVVVNAPDMDIRYYIIGDRPAGMADSRYRYISSRNDISDMMQNGKSIYSSN